MRLAAGTLRSDDVTMSVTRARLELYHLTAPEADWNLELETSGPVPRFLFAGTVPTPALPGPAALDLCFVDDPTEYARDDAIGTLTRSPRGGELNLVAAGEKVSVSGRVLLDWIPERGEQETIELLLEVEAALETR